ncbi:MAG: peptidoglycan-binding domain-containing protein [Oscillospiraceae bacterium]|nr:peptidoglycan-binding domain-containing protein [Oscillospiraceae bacterium]
MDGDFGFDTESAVKQFQKNSGIEVDGIVGKDTWSELMR